MALFYSDTLCHAVTLTFDQLTLKVRGTSSVTWPKSVRNLSEFEQSPAELLIILRIFAQLCHAVTLIFDILTLSDVLNDAKFHTFWPLWKLWEGWARSWSTAVFVDMAGTSGDRPPHGQYPVPYRTCSLNRAAAGGQLVTTSASIIHRVRKKGATLFFAVTLSNPNRSSKFFYHHTQQ